jgi:prolipoprotein diacylglyceryl transferase
VTAPVSYLATIPSPTQGVWFLGPIPIRAYALCILVGIVAACAIAEVRLRQRGAPKWLVLDIAVWAVPFGIVGGRIYHVITSPDAYFGTGGEPIKALYIWEGGLGIWGAIALGAVGAMIACRRMGLPLTFFADAVAPGLPVAQAIGRLGNWFNNELYGGPTTLPWGLRVYDFNLSTGKAATDRNGDPIEIPGGPFQPTFLYELLWNLGAALVVWQVDKRWKLGKGRAFAVYVMAYTAGRFWIEALRIDPAHGFLGMRLNNWVSILVFAGALIYFLRVRGPQEHVRADEDGNLTLVTAEGEPIRWRKQASESASATVAGTSPQPPDDASDEAPDNEPDNEPDKASDKASDDAPDKAPDVPSDTAGSPDGEAAEAAEAAEESSDVAGRGIVESTVDDKADDPASAEKK